MKLLYQSRYNLLKKKIKELKQDLAKAKISLDEYEKLKGTHSELENELKNVRDLLNDVQKENKEFKI